MPNHDPLATTLDTRRGAVNVVLFSRPDCIFCRMVRERHLLPLQATRPAGVHIAEFSIEGQTPVTGFDGKPLTESALAARYQASYSPTVVFLDSAGRERAERLTGYSEHFFESYLQARIETAGKAVRRDDRF